MCGVAGWLGHQPDGKRWAEGLAGALRHRGPDGRGVRSWPDATLVHTRLAIIDLSPAGAQPMSNEDGTVWVAFNGEIYNHRDLRAWLEAHGHRFRGRSDTEVLPHLYEELGEEMMARLRGMFAFALYDARRRTLLLARDRFGIKPLFYAPGEDRLAFASEVRPLLALPGVDGQPDPQAVSDFAALLYVPAPLSFFRGIRALEPGELLTAGYENGVVSWRTRHYHRWTIAPDPGLDLRTAVDRAEELVEQAVERELETDVPLGALLSGGIDSSLVSAAAQRAIPGIRTFNVQFPEESYDETWAAVAVADHIGSEHRALDMGAARGTWEDTVALLEHCGQPFADTSLFPVSAVCREMRQHVTVALSGDGGDEGFGGYNLYWQLVWLARWRAAGPLGRSAMIPAVRLAARLGVVGKGAVAALRSLARADDVTIVERFFRWIPEEEHRRLCWVDRVLPVRRLFEPRWEHLLPSRSSRVEHLTALATEANVRLALAGDYLFKVDAASMREALEVRVPMLDENLFQFGLTLPHRLKVRGRQAKRVLRGVARRRLPGAVAAKRKQGFGIPFDAWVDEDWRTRLREELFDPGSSLPEFFRPAAYRPLVEAFCQGRRHPHMSREGLYQRVVMLLAVHLATAGPARRPALGHGIAGPR